MGYDGTILSSPHAEKGVGRLGRSTNESRSQWAITFRGRAYGMKEKMKFSAALAGFILFSMLLLANRSRTYANNSENLDAPEDTKTLYDARCAKCHGSNGRAKSLRGKVDHARDFTDAGWQSNVSDERLFNSITNGRGKMPAFKKKLSEQQIDALVTYVRQFKR